MEAMAAKLVFPQDNPPLSIISAAKIAGVPMTTDPCLPSGSVPTLHFVSGDFIHGVNTVLRYIARTTSVPSFYGEDAIQAARVDEWLEYAPLILSGSEFDAACSFLDGYLASRTFLVGHGLTVADTVVWSNLRGAGQRWESLRRSRKYQNLVRWFNSVALELGEDDKPGGEKFLENLNPCTRREALALGDPNMRNIKRGEVIQLERKGYYRCDVPFVGSSKPIMLFAIPDGRLKSTSIVSGA